MHEATSTDYLVPPISGFSEFFFVLLCVKIKQKSHLFNLFAVLVYLLGYVKVRFQRVHGCKVHPTGIPCSHWRCR